MIRHQRAVRLGCSCCYTYIVRLEDLHADGTLVEHVACPSCGVSAGGMVLEGWVP